MKTTFRPYLYLLAAVILAGLVMWMERPDRSTLETEHRPLLPPIDAAQVTTIEIEQLLNGVKLTRQGGAWNVEGLATELAKATIPEAAKPKDGDGTSAHPVYAADPERVHEIFEALANLRVGAVASRNAEHQDQLQVGKLARQVRLKNAADEIVAAVSIGKSGPDYFSTYVRKSDEDVVYLVPDQLQGRFATTIDAWRNKTVWTLDPDQMQSIEVDRYDGGFTLKKVDGQFVLTAPKDVAPLDAEQLKAWLSRWTTIRTPEFPHVEDFAKTGLDKPAYSLMITLADGTQRVLAIGNEHASGNLYGITSGATDVFLLPTEVREALKVDWEEWIAKSSK